MEKQQGPIVLEENYCPEVVARESEIDEREDYISSQGRIAGPGILGDSEDNDGVLSADLEAGGEVHPRGPPTSGQVADFIEFFRIQRIEIVLDLDVSIDAVIGAPNLSPTDRDDIFLLPVSSGPTMCSVAAGQGAPSINGVPDAMMSLTESPGADGTLPIFIVNRPIRSSLEVAMSPTRSLLADPEATQVPPISPPIIDESSAALNLNRTTHENLEAAEVPARSSPTSPVVDFIELLMEVIDIFIGFLAIVMELVSVLVPSNKHVGLAVLVLTLINWLTTWTTFVSVARHRGAKFQFPYFILSNGKIYGWKLDYLEIVGATLQVVFGIVCSCLKLWSHSINLVVFVLFVAIFSSKMTRKYHKSHS